MCVCVCVRACVRACVCGGGRGACSNVTPCIRMPSSLKLETFDTSPTGTDDRLHLVKRATGARTVSLFVRRRVQLCIASVGVRSLGESVQSKTRSQTVQRRFTWPTFEDVYNIIEPPALGVGVEVEGSGGGGGGSAPIPDRSLASLKFPTTEVVAPPWLRPRRDHRCHHFINSHCTHLPARPHASLGHHTPVCCALGLWGVAWGKGGGRWSGAGLSSWTEGRTGCERSFLFSRWHFVCSCWF